MSTAVMTAKLGTDAFAAHQVGMNIMSLSFSFGDGMQVAAVALIGRSLGEEKPDMARLYGLICQRMGNAASLVLSAFYLLCGGFLFSLYFREPHIVSMGVMIMRIMVLIVIMQIAQCYLAWAACGRRRRAVYHHYFHLQRHLCPDHQFLRAVLRPGSGAYGHLAGNFQRSAVPVCADSVAVQKRRVDPGEDMITSGYDTDSKRV